METKNKTRKTLVKSSDSPISCNNVGCKLSSTCFRFFPKNPMSGDLEYKKRGKCVNYIHWDKEEFAKLK